MGKSPKAETIMDLDVCKEGYRNRLLKEVKSGKKYVDIREFNPNITPGTCGNYVGYSNKGLTLDKKEAIKLVEILQKVIPEL